MTTGVVLVTRPTDTVGRHAVDALSGRDVTVRTAVRDPESAPDEIGCVEEAVQFDFTKPETRGPALADVGRVFLVPPPVVSDADVTSFVDAADRVGVGQIAYLSTLGANKNFLIPHHRIEKRILATDVEYTLLRGSFFMQNLLEVDRRDIVEHDEIFVPTGTGNTSIVDARNIGEAAAVVLTESGHANRANGLTGRSHWTTGKSPPSSATSWVDPSRIHGRPCRRS